MAEIRDIAGYGRLAVDSNTRALTTIGYEHHEVHAGDHFTFVWYDDDMDNAETKRFLLTTPATPQIHMIVNVTGAATTLYQLYEDTTLTSTDTAETSYNNNRTSTDAATLTIQVQGTTDAANGNIIDVASFGLDTGVGSGTVITGGSGRGEQEWALDYSSKYLIVITSNADNNNVTLRLSWYEHTPKL